MNKVLVVLLFLISLSAISQVSPVADVRIPSTTDDFGTPIPVGWTVYDNSTGKKYFCISAADATDDLTSAAAKFKEITTTGTYVTSVTATSPVVSSGGYTPNISIDTNKVVLFNDTLAEGKIATKKMLIDSAAQKVYGTGVAGYIPHFLNSKKIDSSALYYDALNKRLGIGTTAPAAVLHNFATTEQLRLGYNSFNYGSFTVNSFGDINYTSGGGDEFDFWNGLAGAAYVDIGQGGSSEKQLRMFNGNSVVNRFSTTGNSFITAGNVGIGTTAPTTKLDVQGTGRFSGSLALRTLQVLTANDTVLGSKGTVGYFPPNTFAPYSHTQAWTTITGAPGTYTPTTHTHSQSDITGLPDSLANIYTEAQVNALLGAKQNVSDTSTKDATRFWVGQQGYITGNQTITLSGDVSGSGTTAITTTVADDSHNHIISNVDALQDSLNDRFRRKDTAEVLLSRIRAGHDYSVINHNHSGTYDNYNHWSFGIEGNSPTPIYSTSVINLSGGYGITVYGDGSQQEPHVMIDSSKTATQYDLIPGNTAYGWGDHTGLYPSLADSNKTSAGNYITRKYLSDNYVSFPGFGTSHATAAYGDHNHSGVYEPVVSKSTGYLTWDGSAWSWKNETYSLSGHNHDHNALTNYIEAKHFYQKSIDTINTSLSGLVKAVNGKLSAITDNSSNWDAAYGWGNHAGAGYLTNETFFFNDTTYIAYLLQENEFNRNQTIKNNSGNSYLNIIGWEDKDSTAIKFTADGKDWEIGVNPGGVFRIQTAVEKPLTLYIPNLSGGKLLSLDEQRGVQTIYSVSDTIQDEGSTSNLITTHGVWDKLYSYVPYTGAITDVNLGSHNLTAKEVAVTDSLTSANFMITKEGGYAVKMIAGCSLEQGDVVRMGWANGTVTKTTSVADSIYENNAIGVAYNTASATQSVWVVTSGKALVKFTSTYECEAYPNGETCSWAKRGYLAAIGYQTCFDGEYTQVIGGTGKAVSVRAGHGVQTIGIITETKAYGESAYVILSINNNIAL